MFSFFKHSYRRMRAIALVETLRLLRDRTSFSLVVVVPAFQVILFGYAVNLDPKQVSVAVAGGGPSAQVRAVELIETTGYFREIIDGLVPGEARKALENGRVMVAVELPDDGTLFDELDGVAEENDQLATRLYADGTEVSSVAPALAALENALWKKLARQGETDESLLARYEAGGTTWLYNPDKLTAWTILPALMGVIVMISMLMLGALTLVKEREQGSWEALVVMPISALDALVGKLGPYLVVAAIQVLLVLAVSVALFQLPTFGSLFLFGFGGLLLSAAHLVLGFALSTIVSSQLQALQAAVAFYLPSMLLSGFMFPFTGMPAWAQTIGNFLPLTHFVRLSRDILLKGAGISEAFAHIWPIALFMGITILVALPLYRRRLA